MQVYHVALSWSPNLRAKTIKVYTDRYIPNLIHLISVESLCKISGTAKQKSMARKLKHTSKVAHWAIGLY